MLHHGHHHHRPLDVLLAHRDEQIQHARLTLSKPKDFDKIIACTAIELKQAVERGQWTRHEVMSAFILRAADLKALGGLAEVCFDEALKEEQQEERDHSRLLFAGVPISLKEELQQKSFVSTCGLLRKANRKLVSPQDGLLVHLLKANAGLIPHVRSNLPTLVMSSETDNDVYGLAVNPYNAARMVGGSSGGEGVLISSRCSPLGIGSDIAGSVRIPAMACGLFSFKPTPGRVSTVGFESVSAELGGCEGQNLVRGCPGPMARCVEDLAMVMRTWLPNKAAGKRHGGATGGSDEVEKVGLWNGDASTPQAPFDEDIYRGRKKRVWLPLPGQLPILHAAGSSTQQHPPLPFSPPSITSPLAASPVFAGNIPAVTSAVGGSPPHSEDEQEHHLGGEDDDHIEGWQQSHQRLRRQAGIPPRRGKVPLKIGYFLSDGGTFFEPASVCKRAVLEAADALREAGCEVVEFEPFDHGCNLKAATLAYGALLGKDAMAEMQHVLGPHGKQSYLYSPFVTLSQVPDVLPRKALAWLLRHLLRKQRWADIVESTSSMSMLDSWEWNRRRNYASLRLSEELMKQGIDCLLSPGLGIPAWLHGQGPYTLEWSTGYCWWFNYLSMPAGVVPVTRVRTEEQGYYHDRRKPSDSILAGFPFGGDDSNAHCSLPYYQRDSIALAAHQALQGSEGLPVGVQISSLTNQDEVVLRAMRELEGALKARRRREEQAGVEVWEPARGCPEELVQRSLAQTERVTEEQGKCREEWRHFPSFLSLLPLFLACRLGVRAMGMKEWLIAFLWAIVAKTGEGSFKGLLAPFFAFFSVIIMASVPPPVILAPSSGSTTAVAQRTARASGTSSSAATNVPALEHQGIEGKAAVVASAAKAKEKVIELSGKAEKGIASAVGRVAGLVRSSTSS
jgi:Asp-tRNA(Asn)/Glu-tRNA(Gln) amidotransferase A subunit family amidase